MTSFHYSLNNSGYLVLANAETVSTPPNLFSQVDIKLKIYAKKIDMAARPS